MGIDGKYGRVILQHGTIDYNEPVVVFRARDDLLPKVLAYYHLFCLKADSPKHHLDLILKSRDTVLEWQKEHGCHIPMSESLKPKEKS